MELRRGVAGARQSGRRDADSEPSKEFGFEEEEELIEFEGARSVFLDSPLSARQYSPSTAITIWGTTMTTHTLGPRVFTAVLHPKTPGIILLPHSLLKSHLNFLQIKTLQASNLRGRETKLKIDRPHQNP